MQQQASHYAQRGYCPFLVLPRHAGQQVATALFTPKMLGLKTIPKYFVESISGKVNNLLLPIKEQQSQDIYFRSAPNWEHHFFYRIESLIVPPWVLQEYFSTKTPDPKVSLGRMMPLLQNQQLMRKSARHVRH
jgi:hypothetical protein